MSIFNSVQVKETVVSTAKKTTKKGVKGKPATRSSSKSAGKKKVSVKEQDNV